MSVRAAYCQSSVIVVHAAGLRRWMFYLPPTKEEIMFSPARPCSFVCLSVCLCARLLKNACMDLDEMLRIDRCRDIEGTD